uniref:Reverse transcriptase domain-containing protein n=1 Tax=Tanacetum cinerariifolium TaxID=118510 RepID=A0A6L2KDD6_TANCI|nr:reverse transcriptase domain-containing protein [Tanacetum cinerariifolium]
MITPVEKRNASKFCEFHKEVGHTIDECMHLKMQIEETLKAGKLSHLIKELKQSNGKDQQRLQKRGKPQKTKSKENLGNSVYNSRNVEISSDRRNSHIAEYQDYSARMHNGLRTKSTATHNQSSHRRKDSGSNPPRISRINCSNRLYLNIRWSKGAVRSAKAMRECTFLGFKVSAGGLKVCMDKVKAVLSPPSPKCLKDVQRLNRKLASLTRFLSKSTKKSLPFFKTLKKCTKKSDFQWTAKAKMAFKQMKKLIAKLPMLAATKEKEELIIYLTAAKKAISAVLVTKRNGKQVPIYFVSRPLQVDFIVERPKDDPSDTPMEDEEELPDLRILFTDGSSCIDGSRAGLILKNPKGMEFTYALRFRETPFSLTYETEAVILVEMGMPTLRTMKVNMIKNDEALEINLDLLEEKREQTAIQEAKSKAKMERYYNARVRNTSFKPGELVYRNNEASDAKDGGKLEPKWEGPYEATKALGKGVYKLKDHNGNLLPRTWNVCNLKKCYVNEM